MNHNYDNINFNAFSAVKEDCVLTEKEKEKYIAAFYKNAGLKRDHSGPEEEIQEKSKISGHPGPTNRKKWIALAAAMTVIFSFGAVAYGAGWFELGALTDHRYHDEYELFALKDSSQHKAAQEIQDYEDSLSLKELRAEEEERCNGTFEDVGVENETENSITFSKPGKKVLEILEKYDLKYERTHYYVTSAKEAFQKAGIGNILGSFCDVNTLKVAKENVGQGYVYTDQGSVYLTGSLNETKVPIEDSDYWEMRVVPMNVYTSQYDTWTYDMLNDEKEDAEYEKWNFETDDGHAVRAISYKNQLEDNETTERNFECIIMTKTHRIQLYYSIPVNQQNGDRSNQDFETMVNKLNLSAL